jgi:hypothetical protein
MRWQPRKIATRGADGQSQRPPGTPGQRLRISYGGETELA